MVDKQALFTVKIRDASYKRQVTAMMQSIADTETGAAALHDIKDARNGTPISVCAATKASLAFRHQNTAIDDGKAIIFPPENHVTAENREIQLYALANVITGLNTSLQHGGTATYLDAFNDQCRKTAALYEHFRPALAEAEKSHDFVRQAQLQTRYNTIKNHLTDQSEFSQNFSQPATRQAEEIMEELGIDVHSLGTPDGDHCSPTDFKEWLKQEAALQEIRAMSPNASLTK